MTTHEETEDKFSPERLRWPLNSPTAPVAPAAPIPRRRRGRFLKGPVPLDWIGAAASLPGKALAVAMALRYQQGLRRSDTVRLTSARLRPFGIDRQAARRGLIQLETAGLVQVERHPGRAALVTIRECPVAAECNEED